MIRSKTIWQTSIGVDLAGYLGRRYTEVMTYFTDADIEMAELAQMGNDIANGVCPRCEDVLDPHAARWAGQVWYHNPALTADDVARMLGPHSNIVEGYHDRCIMDLD